MKKIVYIVLSALALASCVNLKTGDPYDGGLYRLVVEPVYPEGFPEAQKAGIPVSVTDRNLGNKYSQKTGPDGNAVLDLPVGSYRVAFSYNYDGLSYNGIIDKVILGESGGVKDVKMTIKESRSGKIVFKEIYSGGCTKYPEQGNYLGDSYVILHNNTFEVQYLDGLCFGALDPSNSIGTNPWVKTDPVTGETVYQDFVPLGQAVWQIGGNGTSFPLKPGEDAVIVVFGAIDHQSKYPNSVNLNNSQYFVCFNTTYFPNPAFHPAPGNNIKQDHILDVVVKTGKANAFTFSINSPAPVIFRAPEGTTMKEFVSEAGNIIPKPGSTSENIVKLPVDWVIDGVEVFVKGGANKKRLCSDIDAGAVDFSGSYQGHSLFRKTDDDLSQTFGFEVLSDTNNSTNDFYEREKQSLHE